ncbi:MAG: hypothetical protein M3277_03610 [Actinomycetota bacterium]|nr:hypothetical protein [Actinomycetota bacterium]
MRKMLTMLVALGLAAGALVGPAESAKKKKSGPVVVGKDDAGDWGANVDPQIYPAGDALGQDLVGAALEMAEDGKTINFIIQLNSLPPIGGAPEVSRYTWDFTVDNGDQIEIDGKFTNYTRGACDPTSGQCPPPRDPGLQPFLVRGNCHVEALVATNFTICEELARVQAIFDPAEGTITVPVPMDAIKAKPGSKISGAAGTFGTTVNAAPSAFVTTSRFPMDGLITTKTFVVPR